MKYRFSPALRVDYVELKKYLEAGDELTKKELLEKCSGQVSFDLLQYLRELEFELIGKDNKDQLYIR